MADDDAPPTKQELNYGRPSTLDRTSMARVLKSWFRQGAQHSATWRKEADEDFDFKAGRQWSNEEKAQLKDQLRPEVVFNRALTTIKAVAGFEINNRHEIHYLPRTVEETAVNETLNGASKWMGDEAEAEDEESQAFQDCVICGMGWTGPKMSYDEDTNGLYDEPRINPLEMYWDGRARKRNIGDTRWRAWLRKCSLAEARELSDGATYSDDELDAKWAHDIETEDTPRNAHKPHSDFLFKNDPEEDEQSTDVHVVQIQWYEKVPVWIVADPATNKKIELDDAKYKIISERMQQLGMKLTSARGTKKVFYQAFVGGVVIACGPAPQPDRFTLECITAEPDENKGTWFGLMRVMRDPAKWSNKFLSQIMHIINSNAKGGIMAEPDAFDDQRQAEESYARPEAITWLKKGAMGSGPGGSPKFMKKPSPEFPAGIFQLLEFAVSSIRDVTGINLELLGQKDVNQPGILEAQRKQAGMTVMATMFDSLRRFRKRIGRIRLYYIQNFLSDGRLIRIVGQDGAKVIPLIRDKCLGQYDVVVDDAPTSPNQKEQNWALIAPLLPVFKEQLMMNPKVLIELLRFSPLPSRVLESIEAVLDQPDPTMQAKQQIEQQLLQLQIPAAVAKISKDQSTAEMQNAKAKSSAATAEYDLAMAQNLLVKHRGDFLKATSEWLDMQQKAQQSGLDAAHKAAQIDQTRAQTDKIRADTGKSVADTHSSHADAMRTRIGSLIDAMTPIQEQQPQQAA